jgi:hypothetical protein
MTAENDKLKSEALAKAAKTLAAVTNAPDVHRKRPRARGTTGDPPPRPPPSVHDDAGVHVAIHCEISEPLVGGNLYSISLTVKNVSPNPLVGVQARAQARGRPVGSVKHRDDTLLFEKTDALQATSANLSRLVVQRATDIEGAKRYGRWWKIFKLSRRLARRVQWLSVAPATSMLDALDPEAEIMSSDIERAFHITEPADLERLKRYVEVPQDGDLRDAAIRAEADRFHQLHHELADAAKRGEYPGAILLPGTTFSSIFSFRAPLYTRTTATSGDYRVTYRSPEGLRHSEAPLPMRFAANRTAMLICGGMGASAGACLRAVFLGGHGTTGISWPIVAIASLIGVVATGLAFRRSADQRGLVVEDTVGAFIAGCAAGVFSEELLRGMRAGQVG